MAYKDLLARTVLGATDHLWLSRQKVANTRILDTLLREELVQAKKSVYPVAKRPSFIVLFSGAHKALYNMKSDTV